MAATLEPRTVGSVRGEFFIPAYQRGYRWGEQEVRLLLDDIAEARGSDYYLQPVVVKKLDDDRWELVDGQQRLTTLYLTLRAINRYLPFVEPQYSLSYETRPGSATYLDNPTEAGSLENIDYFHVFAASRCIEIWFASRPNPSTAASKLNEALDESVRVIWYEAPDTEEFDSRTLFTRLNVGRIPLTDAELVKALLLSRVAESSRPRRNGTASSVTSGRLRSGPSRRASRTAARPASASSWTRLQTLRTRSRTGTSGLRSTRSRPCGRRSPTTRKLCGSAWSTCIR